MSIQPMIQRADRHEPPGGPILGIRNFFSDLANIPSGLLHLGRGLIGGPQGVGDPSRGELLGTFGKEILRSFLTTASAPIHMLPGDQSELFEFIPEDIRPRNILDDLKERGLLSVALENVGNLAIGAAPVAGAARAAGATGVAQAAGKLARPIRGVGIPAARKALGTTERGERFLSIRDFKKAAREEEVAARGGLNLAEKKLQESVVQIDDLLRQEASHIPLDVRARLVAEEAIGRATGGFQTDLFFTKEALVNPVVRDLAQADVRPMFASLDPTDQDLIRKVFQSDRGNKALAPVERQVREGNEQVLKMLKESGEAGLERVGDKTVTLLPGQQRRMRAAQRNFSEGRRLREKALNTRMKALEALRGGKKFGKFNKEAKRLEGLAKTQMNRGQQKYYRTLRDIEFPDIRQVPPEWRDIWRARSELQAVIDNAPFRLSRAERQAWREEFLRPWSEVVEEATRRGFDPSHFREFGIGEVRAFIENNVRLGPTVFRERMSRVKAGTREAPLGRRKEGEGVSRSFEALLKASHEALWEKHSNRLTDYIQKNLTVEASVLTPDQIARREFVPWRPGDPDNLVGILQKGVDYTEDLAKAVNRPELYIHRDTARAMRRLAADVGDNPFVQMVAKGTDPWRTMILTYSPRWYVNNAVGNFILTAAEIGTPAAINAWWKNLRRIHREVGIGNLFSNKWAQRFTDIDFPGGRTPGELMRISPALEVPRGPMRVMTPGGGAAGMGLRESAQMGKRAFARNMNTRMQRMNEVFDEIARTSVLETTFRRNVKSMGTEGAAAHALQRARRALVDYSDLGPFERSMMRSMIPFYAWQKGILKVASNLAADHPIRTHIYMLIGRINTEQFEEEKAELPQIYQSLVPLTPSTYLQTRGMNPFADAASLVTPEGISSSLNPFVDIAVNWVRRQERSPFGPKEVGPLGFAQGRVELGPFGSQGPFNTEIGRLISGSIGGGIPGRIARGEDPLVGIRSFMGIPTVDQSRAQDLRERHRRATRQVEEGLPLPPPEPQLRSPRMGLLGRPSLANPILQRTQGILGISPFPLSISSSMGGR